MYLLTRHWSTGRICLVDIDGGSMAIWTQLISHWFPFLWMWRNHANTKCSPNVWLMLAHRRRRWAIINHTLGQNFVFDGERIEWHSKCAHPTTPTLLLSKPYCMHSPYAHSGQSNVWWMLCHYDCAVWNKALLRILLYTLSPKFCKHMRQ